MPKLIDADKLKEHYAWWDNEDKKIFDTIVDLQPIVDAVEVVRCKDCKYFRDNKVYNIQGFPIMGNSVCDKWANGCRTDENGYCFLGERREDER